MVIKIMSYHKAKEWHLSKVYAKSKERVMALSGGDGEKEESDNEIRSQGPTQN
jgi:hypothetical protein